MLMIRYQVRKNMNAKSKTYGRYYAYAVSSGDVVDLRALAEHMEKHNSGFSKAMCLGVMTAMVNCIKEMVLDGKRVKIDDLAIFSCSIKNSAGGALTEEKFTVTENIEGAKLRARATGVLTPASLNLEATFREATVVNVKRKKKDGTTDSGAESGGSSSSGTGSDDVNPGN